MNLFTKYLNYIKDNPQHYWFKRKMYGWGWTPASWQGWLVTILYIGLIVFFSLTVEPSSPKNEIIFTFIFPIVLITISFVRILYKKGESPRWQWGITKSIEKDK